MSVKTALERVLTTPSGFVDEFISKLLKNSLEACQQHV